MSYDIVVRVAAEGDTVIDKIERGLDDATAAAGKASAAVSGVAEAASKASAALVATGDGSTSMDKAREAAQGAASAVAGLGTAYETALEGLERYRQSSSLPAPAPTAPAGSPQDSEWEEMLARSTANLQREKEVLESIHGPMREYSADMDALARVYDKGQLSAAEYTNATDALIKKQQTMHGPVQQVTEAMKNEERILQSIRGPMQQYTADMEALDALFKRGAIDLDEMSKKSEQLASKAGLMHGPVQQQQAEAPAAAGPSLDAVNGITQFATAAAASGAGIFAMGHAIDDVVKSMHDIEDVSIRATNAAQKFVDAQHSATDIIAEQLEVADKLHASYDTTIKLYDKVREGSEGVALSHREQLDMTRVLGEAVQLSNKPIESAAALMSRFSFAMQSGTIEGRALKSMMREVPAIADLWREAFHTNDAGLMDMVKHGKITIADLVAAIANGGDKMDARFKNINRTNEQSLDEYIERFKLAQTKVEQIRSNTTMTPVEKMNELGANIPTVASGLKDMFAAIDDVDAAAKRADATFTHWLMTDGIKKMRSEFHFLMEETDGLASFIGRTAGVLKDPWGGTPVDFGVQVTAMEKIKGPINEAKLALQTLHAEMKSGVLNAEEYDHKYRELVTTINDGRLPDAIKIWDELNKPFKEQSLQLGGLNYLWKTGAANVHEFNREMQRLHEALDSASVVKYDDALEHLENTYKDWIGVRKIGSVEVSVGIDNSAEPDDKQRYAAQNKRTEQLAAMSAAMRAQDAAYGSTTAEGQLYNEALARQFEILRKGAGAEVDYKNATEDLESQLLKSSLTDREREVILRAVTDAHTQATRAANGTTEVLGQALGPAKLYAEHLTDIAAAKPYLTVDQYTRAIDENRLALLANGEAGRTFAGGAEAAWLKLKLESDAFGASVATNLIGNVDKFNEAFVKAANDGTTTWHSFGAAIGNVVDGIIQDLEKMLLKQLEVQAVSALFGAASGGGGGGGSAPLDSAGMVALGLTGYATGGQFTVGGSGGTDTTPVHFMATPGERVTIQTPAQQGVGAYPHAAAGGSAATAAPAPIVNVRNVTVLDPSVIHDAMNSPAGEQVILNTLKRNPGATRR